MKTFLTILISLFISLPSFANPSGKGIICECVKCDYSSNKRKIGFIFFEHSVKRYMFDDIKDIISINESGGYFYATSPELIKYKLTYQRYTLHRKSLKLNYHEVDSNTGNKKASATYQCKVIVGEDEFLKEIDNIQKAYQKELDLELKGNKI